MGYNNLNTFLKGIITVTVLLVCQANVFAQTTISGTMQSTSGEAIPFANILLLQPNDSTLIKGEISDQEGQFNFLDVREGIYLLQVSMIGFQPFRSRLEVASTPVELGVIKMSESTEQLSEVVVTAQKTLYEKKIDRTVVNVQSSIASSGKSVLEVIERSPGITVNRQNNNLSMRGKTGVLIMINGKMSRLPIDAVIQMLDGMSAANIEKIELITSPPAKYDAEGDGGIINIVTNDNPEAGTNGNFGITAGFNQRETLGTNFNLSRRGEKISYFIDYSLLSDRNKTTWINQRTLEEESFDRMVISSSRRDPLTTVQNIRVGLEFDISQGTSIKILSTGYRRNWDMDAYTAVVNDAGPDSTINTDMDLHESNIWKSFSSGIGITHKIGDHQELNLDFDYLFYSNDNPSQYLNRSQLNERTEMTEEVIDVTKDTPINFKIAKLDYANQVSDRFSFDAGIKGTFSSFDNRVRVHTLIGEQWVLDDQFTNSANLDEKIFAAYFSWDWALTKDININGGLRYEYTDSFISTPEESGLVDREFGNLFPSLFIARKINEESKVQFTYSRRITRPTFNEMAPFVFFLGPNSFYSGNPALRPAITDGVELGYQIKQWWLSAAYSSTDNSIGWLQPEIDPVTNEQVFRSHNLEYLRSWSGTSSLSFNPFDWWEFQGDVSLYYQTYKTGQFENNFTEEAIFVNLNATNTIKLPKQYSLEISGNYQSKTLFGIWYLRPRGQLNLGIRKKLNKDKGVLSLAATDLLQTNVWESRAVIPEANASMINDWYPKLRSVNLTYTRNFGNKKLRSVNIDSSSKEERNRVN